MRWLFGIGVLGALTGWGMGQSIQPASACSCAVWLPEDMALTLQSVEQLDDGPDQTPAELERLAGEWRAWPNYDGSIDLYVVGAGGDPDTNLDIFTSVEVPQ